MTVILGRGSEGRPQGLKPLSFFGSMRAKPEGLAYLEATAGAKARARAKAKARSKQGQSKKQIPCGNDKRKERATAKADD